MGAPGSYYWTGTVKVLNLTDNTYYKLNDDAVIARRYTYLGKQLCACCESGLAEQHSSDPIKKSTTWKMLLRDNEMRSVCTHT